MTTQNNKESAKWMIITVLLIIFLILISGCASTSDNQKSTSGDDSSKSSADQVSQSIVYKNTQYGFDFALPASWEDYTIVTDKWEGLSTDNDSANQSETTVETGPLLSIRHPKWTSENPRQDIPIMVFTLVQWDSLQQDKFHIGAAPIGPSELGRNYQYVFALPARYNYAFPTGYEEVENILNNQPLQPTENISENK